MVIINPIIRGDSFYLKVPEFSDVQGRSISNPDWQCKISFRGGGSTLDKTANSSWEFILAAADTNELKVGVVFFQVYATKVSTGEKVNIDSGSVEIKPNLVSADPNIDLRSRSRILLDEVQALILSLVKNGGVVEYNIGGRGAKTYDLGELRSLESQLRVEVKREEQQERAKQGLPSKRNSFVKF